MGQIEETVRHPRLANVCGYGYVIGCIAIDGCRCGSAHLIPQRCTFGPFPKVESTKQVCKLLLELVSCGFISFQPNKLHVFFMLQDTQINHISFTRMISCQLLVFLFSSTFLEIHWWNNQSHWVGRFVWLVKRRNKFVAVVSVDSRALQIFQGKKTCFTVSSWGGGSYFRRNSCRHFLDYSF